MRAMVSVTPPAGTGTTSLTVALGKVSALARLSANRPTTIARQNLVGDISIATSPLNHSRPAGARVRGQTGRHPTSQCRDRASGVKQLCVAAPLRQTGTLRKLILTSRSSALHLDSNENVSAEGRRSGIRHGRK